jgi:hypothetical protein
VIQTFHLLFLAGDDIYLKNQTTQHWQLRLSILMVYLRATMDENDLGGFGDIIETPDN